MGLIERIFVNRILPRVLERVMDDLKNGLETNPETVKVYVLEVLDGFKAKGAFLDMLIAAIQKLLENEKVWEMIIQLILNMLQGKEEVDVAYVCSSIERELGYSDDGKLGIDPVIISVIVMAIIQIIKAWIDNRNDDDEEDEDVTPDPDEDEVV